MITYRYAVIRNGLLLIRTLTHSKAKKIASQFPGSIVTQEIHDGGVAIMGGF